MKALLLSGLLAASTLAVSAKAPRKGQVLSYRAHQNLQSLFGNVKDLSWSEAKNNMIRADFTAGDESVTTFFDEQGEVVATTRTLTRDQLPFRLRLDLDQRYAGAKVINMIELSSQTELAYFIEIEKNGKREMLKGYDYGKLSQANLN
jgi:hypothetical protein